MNVVTHTFVNVVNVLFQTNAQLVSLPLMLKTTAVVYAEHVLHHLSASWTVPLTTSAKPGLRMPAQLAAAHSPITVSTKLSALNNPVQLVKSEQLEFHQQLVNAAANASKTLVSKRARSTLLAKAGHQHKTPATLVCASSTHSLERFTQNAQLLTAQHSTSHVQFTELRCPKTVVARPVCQSQSSKKKAVLSRLTTTTTMKPTAASLKI